jgi:hypothetical protein
MDERRQIGMIDLIRGPQAELDRVRQEDPEQYRAAVLACLLYCPSCRDGELHLHVTPQGEESWIGMLW